MSSGLIKADELPSRVIRARTLRIAHLNSLWALLGLEFGLRLERKIIIESIDQSQVPPRLRQKAKKAMVVLAGGKNLLLHSDNTQVADGHLRARVFLNERVYAPPAECMMVPFGCDKELLEIGTFFQWMRERAFDIGDLKEVLNGSRRFGKS